MRAVIDGKLYDSDKATLVAEWANGDDGSNFDFYREELYITSTGNWFLDGWGGPRSGYGVSLCGGDITSGGRIQPLSPKRAMSWLEGKGEVDALMKYFEDAIEPA